MRIIKFLVFSMDMNLGAITDLIVIFLSVLLLYAFLMQDALISVQTIPLIEIHDFNFNNTRSVRVVS